MTSRSWTWPRPRGCSSSTARAPAPTSPRSARRGRSWPAAARRPGPVSFMRGYDAFAGVIKSGGKTRRAAKMVILDVGPPGHPRLHRLQDARGEEGLGPHRGRATTPSFTGEAYGSVFFQNANHSVRVTDEFMRAVERDGEWTTHRDHRREPAGHVPGPRHLPPDGRGGPRLRRPGHPVRHHHQRLAPCREHGRASRLEPVLGVHVPQRHRCNLASLNLMKFVREDGEFDVDAFRYALPPDDHGPGDPRRQRELPDAEDRGEQPPLPAARAWATRTSARCS